MSNSRESKPDRWTAEQWQAITRQGGNLLVAAAAGSGKTSVLVERIIRKITDPTEPIGVDQLLVVTFTNAAAAEMRHRIGEALNKALESAPRSAHLRRQLALLPRATITTLHSFCLALLRQYYYYLELDPDFRIADQLEIELLRQDVLEDLLEQWYDHDPEFQQLADIMVEGQDDSSLLGLILRLYDFAHSHPAPYRWMEQAVAMFEEDQPLSARKWTRGLLQTIRLELQTAETAIGNAIRLAGEVDGPAVYLPLLEQEKESISRARLACEAGWEAIEQAVRQISFQRLPAAKEADPLVKEQVQSLRGLAKDRVKKLQDEFFAVSSSDYLRDLQKMAPYLKTLTRLVQSFAEAYQREKRARSLVDFSDLEHFALKLLLAPQAEDGDDVQMQPSDIARQLREQFAEVLIDEYQDINLVQETILQMVSRDASNGPANRFMVGDVKQSIYRFRLAEPKLFLEKYNTYRHPVDEAAAIPGTRIDLAANFRSRREVVDAVNYLFRQIMSPGVGELSYDPAAELICRADYPAADADSMRVEVHLIDRHNAAAGGHMSEAEETEDEPAGGEAAQLLEEASAAQLEARLIAQRIRRWMEPGSGEQPLLVFDKKTGGMRPLAYRDIVILLRATSGWGETMMEELRAAGIPVYAEQSGGYFSATEIEVMLSLLRVIDNPLQDIPLAAVLRSPLVRLKEEQLAQIRIHYPSGSFAQAVLQYAAEQRDEEEEWQRRLRRFLRQVDEWRTIARQSSLAGLLSQIYRQTGYLDYVATLENGQQRQANLRALYDRARQYEAASYRGLFRFLRLIDRLQQAGDDLGEARTVGEGEDVVRMMTIHKSKGLEFPVVFVAGLGKRFNTIDLNSPFLLHKDLGFGPQVIDPDMRLRYPSFAAMAIKQQLHRELLAEEMRVLYVALTRAREKLVLVGSAKNLAKSVEAWSNFSSAEQVLADEDLIQAKGLLDWIGRALLRHPAAEQLRRYGMSETEEARQVPQLHDPSCWSFCFYQADQLSSQTAETGVEQTLLTRIIHREQIEQRPADPVWRREIERRLSWTDPLSHSAKIAAKWSVSDLKQSAVASGTAGKLPRLIESPRFITGAKEHRYTRAEVGTIMHTVLQQLDLRQELDTANLREQLSGLVLRQYLTEEEAAQVDLEQLGAFFASPLGQRVKQAKRIYRELPFTLALPAREVMAPAGSEKADADEPIIVQGVIDCLLEEADGRLTLLDFKTDWVGDESPDAAAAVLTRRYAEQIRYYVRAVERIWKRNVAESYLYSLTGGIAIPIRHR
ncbi:helicase-exonuclease AddAB subunit AddA [Brevibacillus fulvus]|uniref:ATP-dependent helicase/nuclease subunit A n=1 Tax=Brevibacillus fulvus TaxID=1125967 RepID=A0A938Y4I1_9BACL|nr:helicase-exonuclease AddAB subunit AddA [Brevibacillus fulvus]MBM7591085.1 ATP-dependent helicase/nuclease subunit A [Brevibacillus fulvus]